MILQNSTLRTIHFTFLGIIAIACICLALLMVRTVSSISTIEDHWLKLQAVRSDKARLESILRASIGYGGMIHGFQNYILRGEKKYTDQVIANIGAARTAINQYSNLGVSEAEKVALDDIDQTLNSYSDALVGIFQLIEDGRIPKEIDEMVMIDDSVAIRGLNTLRSEVQRQTQKKEMSKEVKGRVVANIRASLGYGGMIHEFKNLILRQDLTKVKVIRDHIKSLHDDIAVYKSLSPTIAEGIALEDIVLTVLHYEEHVSDIEMMINKGISETEIDNFVRIDDFPALRGLTTLDREITIHIDGMSNDIEEKLHFISTVIYWLNLSIVVSILFLIFLASMAFNKRVLLPIEHMTALMNTLAEGNTDIEIPDIGERNELGQMAHSLEKFKEDVVYRRLSVEKAHKLALSDSLTGLGNRGAFMERIKETINLSKRLNKSFFLMMIDLDKFKPVNDKFGHDAGDAILLAIAERLHLTCRDTDFTARLGGDEFAIIATLVDDIDSMEVLAKRLIDQINLPIYYKGRTIHVGASIGIAIYPKDSNNMSMLSKMADLALYSAKHDGRNNFKFYKPETMGKSTSTDDTIS